MNKAQYDVRTQYPMPVPNVAQLLWSVEHARLQANTKKFFNELAAECASEQYSHDLEYNSEHEV